MECDAEILQCVFIDPPKDDQKTIVLPAETMRMEDQHPEEEARSTTTTTTVQVVLNQTVLHAQGGGQPTDRGIIQCGGGGDSTRTTTIHVTKVLLDRATQVATHTGIIHHDDHHHGSENDEQALMEGKTSVAPVIAVGEKVKVFVDQENRLILSECHTAGHVIDAAMAQCGLLPRMETWKAYHL